MTMVVQAKTVLIGVDGFSQPFLEELRHEGRLPAFDALARSGVQVPLISTIPRRRRWPGLPSPPAHPLP